MVLNVSGIEEAPGGRHLEGAREASGEVPGRCPGRHLGGTPGEARGGAQEGPRGGPWGILWEMVPNLKYWKIKLRKLKENHDLAFTSGAEK